MLKLFVMLLLLSLLLTACGARSGDSPSVESDSCNIIADKDIVNSTTTATIINTCMADEKSAVNWSSNLYYKGFYNRTIISVNSFFYTNGKTYVTVSFIG